MNKIIQGDCIEEMAKMEKGSVDSVVTDPPYGLSFMSKNWDHGVPGIPFWREALRVAKPGAHLLAFGGTRTYHRLVCAIEDAGWEIRDTLMWCYGSGFPKSQNISKAIDKKAGAEREVVGQRQDIIEKQGSDIRNGKRKITESFNSGAPERNNGFKTVSADITVPATEAAKQWDGWGTALKPAVEPIVLARKPLGEKTIAKNVLEHGCGGLNIDGCRVEINLVNEDRAKSKNTVQKTSGISFTGNKKESQNTPLYDLDKGRFPANLIHDGSEEVRDYFPKSTKGGKPKTGTQGYNNSYVGGEKMDKGVDSTFHDSGGGSASRFFKSCLDIDTEDEEARRLLYYAKASKKDRTEEGTIENPHPTVKPTELMRYLCRLVTPAGGTVLDPFAGSGSTGKGAILEGFNVALIEKEEEYVDIIKDRIKKAEEDIKRPQDLDMFNKIIE